MASKPDQVAVILKYDVWLDDGAGDATRISAAPVVGIDDEGQPMRTQEAMLDRDLAEKLVKSGKASVPLR